VIINEYQATSNIAVDINVTQNPESIIVRSSRRFHHCLHFRPVMEGSIPWNIGCICFALIIPKALLTIAFHSVSILLFSLSHSTFSLCPSHYRSHNFSFRSVLFSLNTATFDDYANSKRRILNMSCIRSVADARL